MPHRPSFAQRTMPFAWSSTRRLAWVLALVLSAVAQASACSVPVFRYALERWPADRFTLDIRTPAEPSAMERALIDGLTKQADEAGLNLLTRQSTGPAGWELFGPGEESATTGLTGPLDAASLRRLVRSPARDALVEAIIAGESAVWLLVTCGDADRDAKAERLLLERIANLKKVAELPEQASPEDNPRGDGLNGPTLRLSFVVHKVARTDPGERELVALVLGADPKLKDEPGPIASAVFGQGRFLPPMAGAELTASTIDDASLFLIGSCSCQVKELNPGADLLLACRWDDRLAVAAQAAQAERDRAGAKTPTGDQAPPRERAPTDDQPAAPAGSDAQDVGGP